MKTRLTIAILTYNRKESLERCINSLLDQVQGKSVDILITDNASTDGTEQYVRELVDRYTFITYHRNKENVDIYGNIEQCFKRATGDYVWTLSDDDMVYSNSVEKILSDLEMDPVFLFLHSNVSGKGKAEKREGTVEIFNDKNEFLKEVGIYITFISAMVYRTADVKKINVNKYWGCLHVHQYALEALKNKGKYIVEKQEIISATSNEKLRYDVYKVWGYEYGELLLKVGEESGFDRKILIEQINYDYKHMIFKMVVKFRYSCKKSDEWDKNLLWKGLEWCPEYKCRYKFVLQCPKFFLPCIQKAIKVREYIKK